MKKLFLSLSFFAVIGVPVQAIADKVSFEFDSEEEVECSKVTIGTAKVVATGSSNSNGCPYGSNMNQDCQNWATDQANENCAGKINAAAQNLSALTAILLESFDCPELCRNGRPPAPGECKEKGKVRSVGTPGNFEYVSHTPVTSGTTRYLEVTQKCSADANVTYGCTFCRSEIQEDCVVELEGEGEGGGHGEAAGDKSNSHHFECSRFRDVIENGAIPRKSRQHGY